MSRRAVDEPTAGFAPGVVDLPQDRVDDAVALWTTAGLTRPWNDPWHDCRRALESSSSTVLAHFGAATGAADEAEAGVGEGRDDELLGTIMVGHDGHRGWVYYLAVAPERRGRGLGAMLVRAAEQWLRDRGVPKMMLMVRRENEAVRSFYERLGHKVQDVVTLGRFL